MKKVLLYTLVIIKNATIIIPFFEGMISALVKMVESDEKSKKEKEKSKIPDAEIVSEEDEDKNLGYK